MATSPAPYQRDSAQQAAFHDAMRKLWEDHITWTRLFIVSAAADMLSAGIVSQHPAKFK